MTEPDLKFDEPKVSTENAQIYLSKKGKFSAIAETGILCENNTENEFDYDQFNNVIYYTTQSYYSTMVSENGSNNLSHVHEEDTLKNFLALAEEIEGKTQLFCELEYLNRKIPVDNTKNVDLKLINQSLILKSSYVDSGIFTPHNKIFVLSNTPLFHLGLFAYVPPSSRCTIVCTKTTVAVCTLFVELCNAADLRRKVQLAVLEEEVAEEMSRDFALQLVGGCVGVVTARCDVYSAVDAFLAASEWYPWRLRRILVQEPVMQRFASALGSRTRAATEHSHLAVDARKTENKTFLLEFFGDKKLVEPGFVVVEAYRTTKEVLGLLAEQPTLAVSVWASVGAEANEIAFGVNTRIVWINNYGLFQGPPLSAAALYTVENHFRASKLATELLSAKTKWLALPLTTRLRKVREAVKKYRLGSQDRIGEVGPNSNSVVTAENNLCIAIRKPVEIFRLEMDADHFGIPTTQLLNYIVEGGSMQALSKDKSEKSIYKLMALLTEAGAPVVTIPACDIIYDRDTLYTVKAIWMSIGTTFAN
ncbi:jg5478 [Pararge aegeria aegeria]|uniref:Jg5478 protein n=2 Tax=Pararge aegeria TaxID=116150 RepID=A0A8S4SLK1_9NEOP|nr:jg5478 [Pararge aegeria aegeria]